MSGSNSPNNNTGDSGNNPPPSNNPNPTNNGQGNTNANNNNTNANTRIPEGDGITVSIQYTYLPVDGTNGTPRQRTIPFQFGAATNNTTTGATGQPAQGTNAAPGVTPATLPTPAGAFVLSFRDIPSTTPQSRLESIVAITAELAMRRFHELHSIPKGIPKEEFEKLPVLTLEQVKKLNNGKESECSICYEPYNEEAVPEDKKRERSEESDTEQTEQINRIKRQRINADTATSAPTPDSSVPTSAGNQTTADHSSRDSANTNVETDNDEHPKYLHSPVELPCHHIFGRECIYKWSRNENSCPLCRHKIAELTEAQNQQQTEFNNNATMQEFERIRNMLYNPSETTQPSAGNQGIHGTSTTAAGGTAGTDEPPRMDAEFNIPMGNPNIIFISPNDWNNMSNRAARTGVPVAGTTPAATAAPQPQDSNQGATSTAASASAGSAAGSRATPNTSNTRRRSGFNWIPITMRNLNPFTNEERTRSNPGPNGIANTTPSNNNAQDSTSEERAYTDVHSLLDNIFNRAGAIQGAANTTSTTTTDTPPINRSATANATTTQNPPPTRLPLGNVPPGLQGHLRNIQEALMGRNQPGNNMFSTGVASFRGQNGNVSTFELGSHHVPNRPVSNNTATTTTPASTTAQLNASSVQLPTTNSNSDPVNNDNPNTEQNNEDNETPENMDDNEASENNDNNQN
ncbi:hypothetical protein C6P45_004633 [Maudiozyma exigua]|uniref:RING-type domain-containing protein n=1 Tax=Maudiozyma exigua TaxID=34358 RepID=A0A9P7B9Q7_MAUEX|nr:hypothetical protein C6P45_004633 [Kazachstania exigua]